MKLLLLLLTLLISSINCNAFMRKVVGDKLDEKDRSAVNLNFQELEQRLSNKRDSRQDIGSSSNPVDQIYVDSITVTNLGSMFGYKVGTFTSSASPGVQSITGVGFKPRLLFFKGTYTGGANAMTDGAVDSAGNQYLSSVYGAATGSSTSACVGSYGGNLAHWHSMDTDGFTLDWTDTSYGAVTYVYIAFQ